jgi:hypothetical protein
MSATIEAQAHTIKSYIGMIEYREKTIEDRDVALIANEKSLPDPEEF